MRNDDKKEGKVLRERLENRAEETPAEGHVVFDFTGPGRVLVQTRNPHEFFSFLSATLGTGNSGGGSTGGLAGGAVGVAIGDRLEISPGDAAMIGLGIPILATEGMLLGWAIELKDKAEKYIIASELDYTIIRPGQLTSNPRSGIIKLSLEPEPTGPVTRADLADMVVWAYDNDESIKKIYQVIGDDPLATQRMGDTR